MTPLTQDDIEFMEWLDQPENINYWTTTETGEKVLMREGWNKAYEEYMRIKQIMKDRALGPLDSGPRDSLGRGPAGNIQGPNERLNIPTGRLWCQNSKTPILEATVRRNEHIADLLDHALHG